MKHSPLWGVDLSGRHAVGTPYRAASRSRQAVPATSDVEGQVPVAITPTARNEALVSRLRGQLILAPLTKGGNLPFRRLCVDFGAQATMSEMVFARKLIK